MDTTKSPMHQASFIGMIEDVVICPHAGKGLGVRAKRCLPRGHRLLQEKPILLVPQRSYTLNGINHALEELGDAEMKIFMTLASAHGQDAALHPSNGHDQHVQGGCDELLEAQRRSRIANHASMMSIFSTNAFEVEGGAGIFQNASRFNHSCIPNAVFSWDTETRTLKIHLIEDIVAGQEVTISYCDIFLDPSRRRWALQRYGFTCACKACTDIFTPTTFAYHSRERRWLLNDLRTRAADTDVESGEGSTVYAQLRMRMIEVLRQEGLFCTLMADWFVEVANGYEQLQKVEKARTFLREALELYTMCVGSDDARAQHVQHRIHNWMIL